MKQMNLNDLQKQLENDVKQAAITSRINKNNKNIQNKNESENDYARAIMVTSIKYFTESLKKFCDQCIKGQAGVKATSSKILNLFDDLENPIYHDYHKIDTYFEYRIAQYQHSKPHETNESK